MKETLLLLISTFCMGMIGLALGTDTVHGKNIAMPPSCNSAVQIFPGDGYVNPELSYQDNGDGTITDCKTKFMWEMKLAANGSDGGSCNLTQPNRSVHCVNNTYTWSTCNCNTAANCLPNGTLFTEFLEKMNNRCDGSVEAEQMSCTSNSDCTGIGNGLCGYAGYRDWHIPDIKELVSIVNYGELHPAIDGIFKPINAPNAANSHYWSANLFLQSNVDAWVVPFWNGGVEPDCTSFSDYARAVRQGP